MHNVPANATAVTLNVTVTQPSRYGYLTVYPDGRTRPTASNLNWVPGLTVANLVTVPVVDGKVDFYNGSGGTVQVIADLAGYYSPNAGSAFVPINPVRILDTRDGTGEPVGATRFPPVPAYSSIFLYPYWQSYLTTYVPPTALVLNVTATQPTMLGFMTVYPGGATRPMASNLNWSKGETIPNQVIAALGNNTVYFYNGSGGTVHVVVDMAGYFF